MSCPAGGVFAVIEGSTLGSKSAGLSASSSLVTSPIARSAGKSPYGVLNPPAACTFNAASRSSANVNGGRNFNVVFSLWLPRLAQNRSANVRIFANAAGGTAAGRATISSSRRFSRRPKRESWS
jgi:hypothetical protein